MTAQHIDHYVDHQRIALCGVPGDEINHFDVVTAKAALEQLPEPTPHFCETCLKAFKAL